MLTLGFAGLPSAGKSTMVNALAGKRVLESGICRTTTEACLVGATNRIGAAQKWVRTKLESDDGVEFCALDLPGICDSEDTSGSFNKLTNTKLVIYTGADVGEKYALKVGEVDKKQVAALITLLRGNSGYQWRRK